MKQTLKTDFGKTRVYIAESVTDRDYTMVIPGYSESITHSKKLVDALGNKGFHAFTFNQPRGRGEELSADPIDRQSKIVLDVLESMAPAGEKVHAVAHSLGSAAVLKAAQEAPERFASLTLMQPVGLVNEQSFPEQLSRVGKKIIKNQVGAVKSQNPDRQPKSGYAALVDSESAMHYANRVNNAQLAGGGLLLRQPALALREAHAAGSYDMTHDIDKIAALGIPVNIVKAHNDEMFDQSEVDTRYVAIADSVSSYSSVADPMARHDTFWLQPERTAQIVDTLIHRD